MATRRPAKSKIASTKLFVLDTNVLMHDPTSLFRFEEHDIFVPMMTLEELDSNKKGMSEVARNARQASRSLDEIVGTCPEGIDDGISLVGPSSELASGRLFLQTEAINVQLPAALPTAKGDNQILAVVMHLFEKFDRKRSVILVSKDINMRIKARALGLAAQDYFNDKVLEDTDLLYTGTKEIDAAFWEANGKDIESWKQDTHTYYKLKGPDTADLLINEFVFQEGEQPLQAWVKEKAGRTVTLETLIDYSHQKNNVWGITARNREQNFALNLLMNPEIDFVTLLGQAGTGKTLLTLAASLTQVLEAKRYSEDHHDPRHRAGGRGHRLSARHRRRKDGPVDGRPRRQPGRAQRHHRRRRRVGPRRHPRPDPEPHQDQVAQLHARAHLHQQVPDHRRGPEPHAQADEDPHHPGRPRHQGGVHGQHRPDRHALPHRGLVGPHLRGGSLQGLAALRPHHPAAGRALAPRRPRGGGAVTLASGRPEAALR
jgi:hypothetical protein